MNYIKYTYFIKNKTFQKCALGGLAIFTLFGSVGYLVKNEFLPHFKNEENEDNKDDIEEDNEIKKQIDEIEDNEIKKQIDEIEDNEIKKQIDEIEDNEKNNDNNLDEYIKNYRENQELLDSEVLKEHLLELNV
jgi:hypothetical protein